MEKIINFLKEISEERNFYYFFNEETKEVWISGYINNLKFDLLVRPIKNIYIKVIYETPYRRVPILFLEEDKALKRLKTIFNPVETIEETEKENRLEGENIFGFSGYSIERANEK